MSKVLTVGTAYQSSHNSVGTKFVLVNDKVYRTDDPKRYITTVKRSKRGQVFSNLCECDENGIPLQAQVRFN